MKRRGERIISRKELKALTELKNLDLTTYRFVVALACTLTGGKQIVRTESTSLQAVSGAV